MNKYELVVIVDAAAPQTEKEGVIKDVAEVVTKAGGRVVNSQVWMDRHRFSFQMKKKSEGTYYLLNMEAPSGALAAVRKDLRLMESVLRSLIIKVA